MDVPCNFFKELNNSIEKSTNTIQGITASNVPVQAPPHPDLIAELKKVEAKYKDLIKRLPGVTHVGIGSLLPKGEEGPTCGGPIGFVIFTKNKSYAQLLDNLISDTIEGVGVKVLVSVSMHVNRE